jgi:hypothetical protein
VRLHGIAQGILVIDVGVEEALGDRLEEVARGAFQVGALGDVVQDRRAA